MADVIIESPIFSSPFREPAWHFKFTKERITYEIAKGEAEAAHNIVGGPQHSALTNGAFRFHEFNFMLSSPLFLLGEQP